MLLRLSFGLAAVLSVCSGTSIAVEGAFKCNSLNPDPTSLPVRVELKESDGGFRFGIGESTFAIGLDDADDKLGEVTVTYREKFRVEGSEWEAGHLEPYLVIHHRCGLRPNDVWKVITVKMDRVVVNPFGQTHFDIYMGVIDLNK